LTHHFVFLFHLAGISLATMNRSKSSPTMPRKMSKGTREMMELANSQKSIDMSTVEREKLPMGVTRVYGSRMKLDATLSPAFLEMRMNYRNLLNEYQVHKGALVSQQYSLMKPRRNVNLEKPKELEYPAGVNKAVWRKVARQREKAREKQERMATASASGFQLDRSKTELDEDQTNEGGSPTAKPDPTVLKEVRDFARNGKVQAVHASLEYPPHSGNGLPVDRIPRALEALSYLNPEPQRIKDAVDTLVFRDKDDAPLVLDEFAVIIYTFDHYRQTQLKAQFDQLDEDRSGSIDATELRRLLWDTGYSVNRETLQEILEEVDKDRSGTVELREFELVIKIVHERFGFSRIEVKHFFDLFDRYDADRSGELSADELAGALGWCGHPTTIAEARDLIDRNLEAKTESLSRPEFLRIMRCVAEEEIEEFRALFSSMDEDGSGCLDMNELSELFLKLGYTISVDVIEESIKEILPGSLQTGVLFEDCVHVLSYIRNNEGFSKKEADELSQVFKKFCGEDRTELREYELSRALNWLGYPLSSSRRRQLWVRVDLDKSGAIHEGEFLKLIRSLREEETASAKNLLTKLSASNTGMLPEAELKAMLVKLGYSPSTDILKKAMEYSTDSSGDGKTDIKGILSVLHNLRELQVKKLRQSAGLSDQQVNKIRSKFGLKVEQGKKIDPSEFERFMFDLFKSARNSQSSRDKIKSAIQENVTKDGNLGLQEMFWIVRTYADANAEEEWAQEEAVVKSAGFSTAQVAQFREAFVKADEDGSGALSDSEVLDVFDNVMSITVEQVNILNEAMEKMDDAKEAIDFPSFLQLMSLMTGDKDKS